MTGAVKTNQVELYGSAFASFAALATAQGGADQELLEKLRNVLSNISEAIESNWAERTEEEARFIENYETIYATTKAVHQELMDHQDSLTSEIAALHKCVVNQTGIVGSATAKRDRNQKLWDDAAALCTASDEEYENAKLQRREERDVIDALRAKVEARFGPGN